MTFQIAKYKKENAGSVKGVSLFYTFSFLFFRGVATELLIPVVVAKDYLYILWTKFSVLFSRSLLPQNDPLAALDGIDGLGSFF